MTKKTKNALLAGFVCILCATGALVWTGCDTASATEDLVVEPSSVTLDAGQSQLFKVSGGYHYDWALEGSSSVSGVTSSAQGSLSSLTGSEVRYTAPSGAALSGSVKLRVTSTIEGSGGGTTNSAAYSVSGSAQITFKSTAVVAAPAAVTPMSIAPFITTLAPSSNSTFTVTGGTAPYTWAVNSGSLGSVIDASGASATYKANVIGTNTLTCTDALSASISATIYQH